MLKADYLAFRKEQHAYLKLLNRYIINGMDGTRIVRYLSDNSHLYRRLFVADKYHLDWTHWPKRTDLDIELQNRRAVDVKTIFLMEQPKQLKPQHPTDIQNLEELAEVCGASSWSWQNMRFHEEERKVLAMTFDSCVQYEWSRHQLLLRENPGTPQLWLEAGKYKEEQGDLQGALHAYQNAMDCSADHQKFWHLEHIGRLYAQQEDFALATEAYLLAKERVHQELRGSEFAQKRQRVIAKIDAFLESNNTNTHHYGKSIRLLKESQLTQATLYYPGSGFDFGPLCLFANLPGLENVVYVDSGMGDALEALQAAMQKSIPEFEVVEATVLSPSFFNAPDWELFFHPEARCEPSVSKKAFGVKFKLRKAEKTINFYFLGTEGVASSRVLMKAGFNIQVMVLQDHGFGGNWTRFQGESALYQTFKKQRALPQMLFVAENTTPWPGYTSTQMPLLIRRGQMHTHQRSIYLRG